MNSPSGLKSLSSSGPRPTTGNPSPSTPTRKYHRSRTYSSPYASDLDFSDSPPSLPNGGGHKTKQRKLSTENTSGTKLPPTRIPKVHRPSTQTQSQTNGSTYPNTPNGVATNSYSHTPNSSYSHSVTPNTLTPQARAADVPEPYRHASLDYPRSAPSSASASASQRGLGIGIPSSTSGSSRSTFDIPRGSFGFSRSFTTGPGIGLMNETPPFPTETSMASELSSRHPPNRTPGKRAEEKRREHEQEQAQEESPPRPSIDSEEGPYEHWYRGEVSRNGGVGELKVGRRQEMLEIANYGHMIRSRDRDRKLRKQQPLGIGGVYEDGYRDEWRGQPQHPSEWTERGQRKRAGSIGGLTNKERERGSLYLDDEDGGERVMDQEPLTDLDLDLEGEEGPEDGLAERMDVDMDRREDLESNKTQVEIDPEDADEFVVVESFPMARSPQPPAQPPQTQRSITPTSTPSPYMQQTPTTNRSTTPTANRSTTPTSSTGRPSNSIPRTRIPSRKSSDSRSTVGHTSATAMRVEVVATMPAAGGGSSSGTSTPQQQASSAQKRGASPGTPSSSSKKARTPKAKSKTAPPSASKKGKENRDKEKAGGGKVDKRTSVAMYPTVEGGEELADAIPSWMEPVSEGNWDDVSLCCSFSFFFCIVVGKGNLDWTPLCSF